MTGVAKGTVTRLLESVGDACAKYQDKTLRNLPCKTIQSDEIWAFCYAKDKNLPEKLKGKFGFGDVWTWVALMQIQNSFQVGVWAKEMPFTLISL